MKHFALLEGVEFDDGVDHGRARTLFSDESSLTLLYGLREGQKVKEHHAHKPVHIVVLRGRGVFTQGDGTELHAGPHSLLILAPEENIGVTAVGGDFVFLATLPRSVPGATE